jgi:hypothetical protein
MPLMEKSETKRPGFFGRRPRFWISLAAFSMAAVAGFALSGAIEDKTVLLLMLSVPAASIVGFGLAVAKRSAGAGAAKGCGGSGAAQARYLTRVALLAALYILTFALLSLFRSEESLPYAVRVGLGILPGLAVIGIFWAIGRLIVEETDEFIRMLTVRQTLMASALALSAASIWGFLESADLVTHIDAYWYAVIWFAGLGFGAIVNRIQHGAWGVV